MKDARVAPGERAVTIGDFAQIGAPVVRWHLQIDGFQGAVCNLPKKFFFRLKMVQHGHGIDASDSGELADGKSGFSLAREQREGGIEQGASVYTFWPAKIAGARLGFLRRFA